MPTPSYESYSSATKVVSSPAPENSDLSGRTPTRTSRPPTDKGDVGVIWNSYSLVHRRIASSAAELWTARRNVHVFSETSMKGCDHFLSHPLAG